MGTVSKIRKYTENDILAEAYMYCNEHKTIAEIAEQLKIPRSTVSWHLLYPLKDVDYTLWVEVRCKCIKYAKRPERYTEQSDMGAIVKGVTERVRTLFGGDGE